MASSAPAKYQHQDYIARVRYSNALPPPPCPPKLLEIPNTGLSSGLYTSAAFASRLAREQPLNIEADAELGMSIDLVGIPGVFDGDESAIQAISNPPPLHAADRALLRPPGALGNKSTAAASGISFLRRTEYITSSTTGGTKFESSNSSNTMRVRTKRRRQADLSEDDPGHIARHILKGFNLAYPADAYNGPDSEETPRGADISSEDKQAWRLPKHPHNPALKLLDSYPLIPDWDALPDTGAYGMYKFLAPPVNNPNDPSYDPRIDVALLRPVGQTVEDQAIYHAELEAKKADDTLPLPLPRFHFEFFLPPDKEKIRGIKRNITTNDPDNEDDVPFDTGIDDEGRQRKFFKYDNIRTYETAGQIGAGEDKYGDTVALALYDPESHEEEPLRTTKMQKAAYFYPIAQRTTIKPRRPGPWNMVEEDSKVHVIEVAARDLEAEIESREAIRKAHDV